MTVRAPLAPARRVGRGGVALGAGAALLFHAGLAWMLLPHGSGRPGIEAAPTFEVELVDQAPKQAGAPAPPMAQATPPVQPTRPPSPPGSAVPSPPLPVQAGTEAPSAPEHQAPEPALSHQEAAEPGPPASPASAVPRPEAASVHLTAGDDVDQEGLVVTGPNVVPARPDALFHNKPPGYPMDAVRRHAEGRVTLQIHVTEAGTPGWVEVLESSNDPSLDRAAQEAVALWHFQPARNHGVPVPFDIPYSFRFSIARPVAGGPGRVLP